MARKATVDSVDDEDDDVEASAATSFDDGDDDVFVAKILYT